MSQYQKQPLSICDLAKHLIVKRRIVNISQEDLELHLQKIGYFHLRGYLYVYKEQDFVEWGEVWSDYSLDEELRLLLFGAISKIEIALRSQLDAKLSVAYGIHWYKNQDLFHTGYDNARQFNANLNALRALWLRVSNDFKRHYENNYDLNFDPPAWMMFETSTLGTLSKYFSSLDNSVVEKFEIANFFGFKKSNCQVLKSWLAVLSLVRNLCAHHARVFSQRFITIPKIPKNFPEGIESNSIFVSIFITSILLKKIDCDDPFFEKIKDFLLRAGSVQQRRMGVIKNWQQFL